MRRWLVVATGGPYKGQIISRHFTKGGAERRIKGAALYEAGANARARKRVAPGYPQGESPYPRPPQLAVMRDDR